jgi:hypothetical protein
MQGEADGDGDGVSNRHEYLCGNDPTASDASLDSDSDGWSNIYEVFTSGTDPLLADSDGDGVNDGSDAAPLVADHGTTGGPELTVEYPQSGTFILW